MELPVDPLVLRARGLLLSRSPESARKLFELMAEHNNMTASLVDVWMGRDGGSASPQRAALSTKSASVSSSSLPTVSDDDERMSSSVMSAGTSASRAGAAKKDGRARVRPELFAPDLPVRNDSKSRPSTGAGDSATKSTSDGMESAALSNDVDGGASSILFSVPDNIRKKPSVVTAGDSVDPTKPTNRLKLAPRGSTARPASRPPNGPQRVAGSSSNRDTKNGRNADGNAVHSIAVSKLDDDSPVGISSPVASVSSGSDLSLLPVSRSATDDRWPVNSGVGEGSGSESDDDVSPLQSSTDRSSKGRKRGHVVISSSEDDSDDSGALSDANSNASSSTAGGGGGRNMGHHNNGNTPGSGGSSASSRRSGQLHRKCKPPASSLMDGIDVSSDEDGVDHDDTSPMSGPSSPSNGATSVPLPSRRSPSSGSGSTLASAGTSSSSRPHSMSRLPLKPTSLSARSGSGSLTPDASSRTFMSGGAAAAATTPTGTARPPFLSQNSRGSSTGGSGGGSRLSGSSGNRKIEAMRKQAKKLSQVRAVRK